MIVELKINKLTGDSIAISEGGSNGGIHVDVEVVLGNYLGISIHDPLLHPVRVCFADDAEDDVGDPLLRQLGQLFLDWEVRKTLGVHVGEANDLLDRQCFILWDSQMPDLLTVDELLRAADDIFKETKEE